MKRMNRYKQSVLDQESNFDRMKRKRKRREAIIDAAYGVAAVLIMVLAVAAVVTG